MNAEVLKRRPQQVEVKIASKEKPKLAAVPGFEPKAIFVKGADQKMTDRPQGVQRLGELKVNALQTSKPEMASSNSPECKRSNASFDNNRLCCDN